MISETAYTRRGSSRLFRIPRQRKLTMSACCLCGDAKTLRSTSAAWLGDDEIKGHVVARSLSATGSGAPAAFRVWERLTRELRVRPYVSGGPRALARAVVQFPFNPSSRTHFCAPEARDATGC